MKPLPKFHLLTMKYRPFTVNIKNFAYTIQNPSSVDLTNCYRRFNVDNMLL